MAIRSKNRVQTNFNMSSMTDIVFLLLIFFIIASTLISPNAIDVVLPQASVSPNPDSHSVNVSITKDLKYYVNEVEVIEKSMEEELLASIKDEEDQSIILRAEETVPVKNLVLIMDIANRNKLRLVIATAPK